MIHPHQYIDKLAPDGIFKPWHISETKELFVSLSLRMVGMSMVGIFVPALLYGKGLSLFEIGLYHLVMIGVRALVTYPTGQMIARFGPKHVLAFSYVLGLGMILALLAYDSYGVSWVAPALAQGAFFATYFTSSMVDFSKITGSEEGGSKLGLLHALIKIAAAIGPLISGVIAVRYGFSASLMVAFVFVAVAIIPLFLTPEPTKTPLTITYQGLFAKRYYRDYVAQVSLSYGLLGAKMLWPLFLAVVVLSKGDFQALGFITSVGFFGAVLLSPLVGRLSDRAKSFVSVIRVSSFLNACVSALRILAVGPLSAGVIGVAAEASALSMQVPFGKGRLAKINHHKGQRIATVIMYEYASMVAYVLIWGVLMILSLALVDVQDVFMWSFIISGLVTTLVPIVKADEASK